ncbi:MAG: hypothetical protein HQL31_14415, partial [Planctomycetes bacterium]|nr:hypothetical protein [Planctomycetota bacterium]
MSGEATRLNITGNVIIDKLDYIEDFKLLSGEGESFRSHHVTDISAPELNHQLDLNLSNRSPLRLVNNIGRIDFRIPRLRIHGPLSRPLWNGYLEHIPDPGKTISLPIRFLNTPVNVKRAQLEFRDDTEWNPMLNFLGESQIGGETFFISVEDPLQQLTSSQFKLSNASGQETRAIIDRISGKVSGNLGSAEKESGLIDIPFLKPKQSQPLQADILPISSGPIMRTVFQPTDRLKITNLAGFDQESSLLEFRVNYSLTRSLQLEISRRNEEATFFGLRLQKLFTNWKYLLGPLPELPEDAPARDRVVWLLTQPPGSDFILNAAIEAHLAKQESLLQREDLRGVGAEVSSALGDFLSGSGYLSPRVYPPNIEKVSERILRHGGKRSKINRRIVVSLRFDPGQRSCLSELVVRGWPEGVTLPAHSLRRTHRRHPLIDGKRAEAFPKLLLGHPSPWGYPSARVVEWSLEKTLPVEPPRLSTELGEGLALRRDEGSAAAARRTLPLKLDLRIEAGEAYTVEQLVIRGSDHFRYAELAKVMGYENGRPYRNSDFTAYRERLLDWYTGQGYFNTELHLEKIILSKRFPRASVHFRVKDGRRFRIRSIELKGLVSTDEAFLRGKIALKEGSWARRDTLDAALREVNSLGIFDNVESVWKETADPEWRVLELR